MLIKLPLKPGKDTTTVSELIKALQQMPPDASILTEGCDCYGDACFVKLNKDGSVDILRNKPFGEEVYIESIELKEEPPKKLCDLE